MKGNNLYNNVVSILVSPLTLIVSVYHTAQITAVFILKSFLINLEQKIYHELLAVEKISHDFLHFHSPQTFLISQYNICYGYHTMLLFYQTKQYKMSTWEFPITSKKSFCNWLYNYLWVSKNKIHLQYSESFVHHAGKIVPKSASSSLFNAISYRKLSLLLLVKKLIIEYA